MEHPLIERNPNVMQGKPIIKGTRITVELLMHKLADGFSFDDIMAMYPHLTLQMSQAAIAFAVDDSQRSG